jgi:hypothetical protein
LRGRRKLGPEQFCRFFGKFRKKIGEVLKNSIETHWRRWRDSKNLEYRNSAGFGDLSTNFTDKLVIFSRIRRDDFRANFPKIRRILPKSINRKTKL